LSENIYKMGVPLAGVFRQVINPHPPAGYGCGSKKVGSSHLADDNLVGLITLPALDKK
jgi:hypothetical protein